MSRASKQKSVKANFHDQLILSKWIWSKFNPDHLTAMTELLDHPQLEGVEIDGENAGQTKFFSVLTNDLYAKHQIDEDTLRRYDLNIVKYWQQITEKRNRTEGHILNLKYFQYLSLLFTEIYLDHYFNQMEVMIDELNTQIAAFNAEQKNSSDHFQNYIPEDLNKVSFWNATGSGKTLLMHVNILQYLAYFKASNGSQADPDQIILLTPNEGLSQQHLEDFKQSGISASLFDKSMRSSEIGFKDTVNIIDINKLGDRDGDKTVATESLEGSNLVLIDEGHRGASSAGIWMERRDILTRNGFSFEYSATFGQAVSKASNVIKSEEDAKKSKAKMYFGGYSKKILDSLDDNDLQKLELNELEKSKCRREALREAYAKNILFDYSYRYFYKDGYGKEVNILNMKDYSDYEDRDLYLTACLLAFFQQQYLYQKNGAKLERFNIEHPLWVFVGNRVNDDNSDIFVVVEFLANFLDQQYKDRNISWLQDLVTNKGRLLDQQGNNIFTNRFEPLHGKSGAELYQEILELFFNATSNQRLNIIRVAANSGELKLQVGENTPFALINVGDEAPLFKLFEENSQNLYLNTRNDEFTPSIFSTLNNKDSRVNLLIGSRKFTEGWSSWRVSTMGLLNMGRGEGSQIIQLFGRGVRLKGENYSLKRTPREVYTQGENRNLHLDLLQTLNIFGLKADYMETFREYLNDEGVILNQDLVTLDFPTNTIKTPKLKTLVLKDGYRDNQKNGFKAQLKVELFKIPKQFESKVKKPFVVLDLYPRLQAYQTDKSKKVLLQDRRETNHILPEIMCLFDFDAIYLQLLEYKGLRGYYNLQLSRENIQSFCLETSANNIWYQLYVDRSELTYDVAGIQKQQSILVELLKLYMDRFYNTLKNAYEGQYYEVTEFSLDNLIDDSELPIHLIKGYTLTAKEDYNQEARDAFERIEKLRDLVKEGKIEALANWQDGSFRAITFDRHLFYPLLDKRDESLPFTWSPMVFDYTAKGESSEVDFILDLKEYINSLKGKEILGNHQLYLFRNADNKRKGLGFALAGNFYPDYLLWLLNPDTGKQYLSLVDPKGIRNINLDDPKMNFYKEIKSIEEDLGDANFSLNSFILSVTAMSDLLNNNATEEELKNRNILFMNQGKDVYLTEMFEQILRN